MTTSNREIRFRIPPDVWDLAESQATQNGYPTERGRTGGPSELARVALYRELNLEPPRDIHQEQSEARKGQPNLYSRAIFELEPAVRRTKCRDLTVRYRDGIEHRFTFTDHRLIADGCPEYFDDDERLRAHLVRQYGADLLRFRDAYPHDAEFHLPMSRQVDPSVVKPKAE